MSQNFLHTLTLLAWIFFFFLMLIAGAYLVIAGRVRIRNVHIQGTLVRMIGILFLLGSAFYYFYWQRGLLHQYGLLIQAVIVVFGILLLWSRAEKPTRQKPLPAATHTYQSGPDEPPYRLHLRLNKDGSGLLVVNAATILHLNPSAAEFAYHMMKGTQVEQVAEQLSNRYRIGKEVVRRDYEEFLNRIQTLIHTPDLDPESYLDFERVQPHSHDLTAPLRLDCALTYRLPAGTDATYAPTKRVDRELNTQEWETIMDKAWAAGIPHITFTGGEATLREDLPELIAHAEKTGQVCGLLTAGDKLADPNYLKLLLQTGLDHLLFILQPDQKASWKALETIMPEDIFTTVHLTITPTNAGSAEETLEKLARLGVKSLSLGASDGSLKEPMVNIRNRAATLGLTLRWDLPVPYSAENPAASEMQENEVPDGAGKAWLYVEPDGDVLPTQGKAEQVLGNMLRDPWEKIYPG